MTSKPLFFTMLALTGVTGSVLADDDYFSAGISSLRVSGEQEIGGGFTAAKINDGNQWGVVSSFDYSKKNDASIYDFMAGPIYQPKSESWLRIYPLVGFGYFYLNGNVTLDGGHYIGVHYDRPGVAYGIGLQASFPDSRFYAELNYKKLQLPNELSDFDFEITYLGVGCNF